MMGLGMSVRFVPSFNDSEKYTPEERRAATVTGKIVCINWEHRYFTVGWTESGHKFRESFKFSEIGKKVKVSGK